MSIYFSTLWTWPLSIGRVDSLASPWYKQAISCTNQSIMFGTRDYSYVCCNKAHIGR